MKARRLVTVLAVAALLLGSPGAPGGIGKGRAEPTAVPKAQAQASADTAAVHQAGETAETVRVARSGELALDFRTDTAEVAVTVLSTGQVWSSNPVDRTADAIAKGVKKQDLNAQLLLDYVDAQNKPFQLNNYTGSIQEKAFSWRSIEDGIEVEFRFPKAEITVPVRYTLKDGAFSAAIAAGRIGQTGKYRLVNAGLLPFFGAGGLQDEGYLFVPDGSGALIRFNNGKHLYKSYNERVYGGDQAVDLAEQSRFTETVRLPVFGMKKNGGAYLAVIHQGAYQAGITAEVSRKSSGYNAVSSYLNLMEFETNTLMAGSPNEKQVVRGSPSMGGGMDYEVRYYFLKGDQADYSGMAVKYREYLAGVQGVKPAELRQSGQIPLLLDTVGGGMKRQTFLGIPYRSVEVLTSHRDIRNMTEQMKERGIRHLLFRYEGWMENGAMDEMAVSLDAEGKLGGDRSFRSLIRDLDGEGITLYPVIDPVRLYENGNGFRKFSDAAKSISRAPAVKSPFLLTTGMKDKQAEPWHLMKPESAREALERFTAAAGREGLKHAAVDSLGSLVYSDFRKKALSKNEAGRLWESGLETAGKNVNGLSFGKGNAYTFPHAESLTDIPLYSSGFDMADEAVPFYSMAVSGLIPAFSGPVNLAGSGGRYLLKLIETGTYPSYRFIGREGSLVVGTGYEGLYSAGFGSWAEDVAEQYTRVNQALLPVMGQPIQKHEKLQPGVYRTTYGNGRTVTVNYTDEAATVGPLRIEPNGYRVQ